MPDGFRVAAFTKLNGDATLTDMLATSTSIYHRRAPKDAGFPYIVYNKQAGTSKWTFNGNPISDQVWLFKAIDRWMSSARAEDIDHRIDEVFTDPVMVLSDGDLLYLRREQDVDYEEGSDPNYVIHNVGGLYRVVIDRA